MARSNENENENENEGTGSRTGLFAGSRYNTYKIAKQAFSTSLTTGGVARTSNIALKYEQMKGGWDAENRSWIYLRDFALLNPGWCEDLKQIAAGTWNGWKNGDVLDRALCQIIDAAGEREDRFAEILHQRDAEGAISYWMTMLGIDHARHPNTVQLIRVARKLGEMVVMCLKNDFDAARPSQLCPAILPMFDPPRTASYPAGHSLQSYLMSYLLLRALPEIPQSSKPVKGQWAQEHQGLFALARRVADNRVIAGVHFDIDSEAGFEIACKIDEWFEQWQRANTAEFANFAALLNGVKEEFPQFKMRVQAMRRP